MVDSAEFAKAVKAAHAAITKAKTKADVQAVWAEHNGQLGHRNLGRLLTGWTPEAVIQKREKAG